MAKMELLKPIILKLEGGFSNNPNDAGKATNKGITIGTYTTYRKDRGLAAPTIDDLKQISDYEWNEIFKRYYWDKWQADKINNQSIANFLVDFCFHSGVTGIKLPQKLLKVKQDGIVGSKTLEALNNTNYSEFFTSIKNARLDFLIELSKKKNNHVFKNGWINRVNSFTFTN